MKVEKFDEEVKEEDKKETCLYKRFGEGVHLLKDKNSGELTLMVICSGCIDALFIHQNNNVIGFSTAVSNKIEFANFDLYFIYIKKLEPDELIVRKKEVDEG